MRFSILSRIAVSLLLLAPHAGAWGEIFVDRAIVRLDAQSSAREDVQVINNGDEVGYVEVEVLEVRNPGTEEEQRVAVSDPDELQLIASPSRLRIPAGGQKQVRIVNLEPGGERERIYRINITPVVPPLEEDDSSVVRVVVAYQLLIMVNPQDPRQVLDIERDGRLLTLQNRGNTNVLFSEAQQCNDTDCVDIGAQRVYPGNRRQVELERDAPVTYKLTSFEGIREARTE